ncbi:methylmalonyl-CoA mutase family protein [Conexibacter sp. JD483]|uniref:methylmalonyl-CoA mutase family protein n=1 Tax=unclassified Conexibacter TaxID=2627773 RepID=UPI0027200AB7|nr:MULTISPECIES: methylmalonyl-CoA mutase family protein [unclassified Conexibacter]MDO8187862.1 methylmalonyl-CoA mutase family protein [Conexibacter sp. CPCC 205706]MDO8201214.1 methylmalonyl-CoA mutase family protein [Conexibacter sp. CPCC 205762]MDR9369774.1 methylmalonyl-CoA mutase family protein [Conexibacter sp. JD483]
MTTTTTDVAGQATPERVGELPLRFVTAASLFDGHDAAINVMRRLIQDSGAEVVHLGHNRSVRDVVRAAIQEDADGIAISSYQGGHTEYFSYAVDMLAELGASHIRVFGGGGGTITPGEIAALQEHGVERIYHPNDGMALGLTGMIDDLIERATAQRLPSVAPTDSSARDDLSVARMLSALEDEVFDAGQLAELRAGWRDAGSGVPVLGITGTGGAGKSTVTDELLARFVRCFPEIRIAVLAVDPTRRRTGGALLGDRIRMNALREERIYMRSFATRRRDRATSAILEDGVAYLRASGFDLVIVETAGIGQSDSEIVDLVDVATYVMTSEFGAASQLEKIDMLDLADLVVINKFDKRGAKDALRDVRKQWRRNRVAFDTPDDETPVYPTIASQFDDPGVSWLFVNLCRRLGEHAVGGAAAWDPRLELTTHEPLGNTLIPGSRVRYLAEIAEQGRAVNADVERLAGVAASAQHLYEALRALRDPELPAVLEPIPAAALSDDAPLRAAYNEAVASLGAEHAGLLRGWDGMVQRITAETYAYSVRGREITGDNFRVSLSGQQIPKIAAPQLDGWGDRLRFLLKENLPGAYPYTGGVFPYRRAGEDPTRMFAGEGTPERTNRRFHYLSEGQPAARLSTAFDSVTLYGEDPAERPDIYGKVGNSGVSIATVDDAKKLYSGFDLCAPTTSVSMTINGPAPIVLAFFMNAAIDQQVEKHLDATGGWPEAERRLASLFADRERPSYGGPLPEGSDGLGLRLLGVSGDQVVDAETYARIKEQTLRTVRGTVQADILKEDQAQNTCIFSTEFALKMMGDVQQYFVDHDVRNFYSVSISGYHIAEAGANPISQLAFTLSNGFTIVEYYLARGMAIDDFAPNLSFFFSNGMDPEYAVIGRVARRIWARAMRERYGASARSQMLKYHVQTSGRSLHAQEMSFNDIRTTLQALYAIFDNTNSLHTNAYDEAITTPTEESVRRAVAIQLIINRELGLNYTENPWQGSFAIERLTDLVEEAVYEEFDRISERGGVLGAMDTMYQRGKIQDESLHYERLKHDGSLPLIGVNTYLPRGRDGAAVDVAEPELARSTEGEKQAQIVNVRAFAARDAARRTEALAHLRAVALARENVFDALLEAVKVASLGQISATLYEVGGEYRRNM